MTTLQNAFFEQIDEIRCKWHVPGLALCVVQNGQLAFRAGSGFRDVEHQHPVTPHTRFAIGSTTKAFTTLALGMLVDAGKLDWDTPVHRYLPDFGMYDLFASERITPRDLVTHCSGLPRYDTLWYFANLDRREMIRRIRYLEPSYDFRQVYQYSNLMFAAAGYLIEQISGVTWEEFVTSHILQPLKMTDSSAGLPNSVGFADFAFPYMEQNGSAVQIPFFNKLAIGPAGSISSSASDLAKWLLLHLNGGEHAGQSLISKENLRQMHSPQMVIRDIGQLSPGDRLGGFPEIGPSFYGLGWRLNTYRGHDMVHHSGSIDGFNTMVSFLPNDDMGIAVLTNADNTLLPYPLVFSIYDRLLQMEPIDWLHRVSQMLAESEKSPEDPQENNRVADTHPSHLCLQDYAGNYEHPAYGIFSVVFENDRLLAHYYDQTFPLDHHHYDVFTFAFSHRQEKVPVSFMGDRSGRINQLTIPLETAVKDIVFIRKD